MDGKEEVMSGECFKERGVEEWCFVEIDGLVKMWKLLFDLGV
ncbi:hypothetical protein [Bacillus subtilis]|nr:hypothetical protein [Bacillus subtilis]